MPAQPTAPLFCYYGMKRHFGILSVVCLPLCVAAFVFCGRRATHNSVDWEEITLQLTVADTVHEMNFNRPRLDYDTPEEAIYHMRHSDHWEEYSAGILPRMTEDALDYAVRLLNNPHDGFIVVDKSRMLVILFDRYGRETVAYPMACGMNYGSKHKKNDRRTPEGFFSVKSIQNSTDWHYVDENGNRSAQPGDFGPRFIRLDVPGITSIGIHGTKSPGSLGGRRSHGCIRIKNENILALAEAVCVGMPVIVSPSPRDMAVNREEGHTIPAVSTFSAGRSEVSLTAGIYSSSPASEDSEAESMKPVDVERQIAFEAPPI